MIPKIAIKKKKIHTHNITASPFVVLAVEEAVEYVAEGADMVEVVQDDHSGELCVHLLRVALLRQVGQVLPQVLGGKRQNKMMH